MFSWIYDAQIGYLHPVCGRAESLSSTPPPHGGMNANMIAIPG